jgi:hypothetical protein
VLETRSHDGFSRLGGIGRTRAYVAVWLVALILAIAAPASTGWILLQQRPPLWTPFGVTADFHATGIWDSFGREARAAGIISGDRVIAIDGVPVEGVGRARVRQLLRRAPGEAVTLTVRSANGRQARHTLHWRQANVVAGEATPGRRWERGTTAFLVFGGAQALLNIAGAFVLFGRRRDPMAALFSIAILFLNAYGLGEWAFYELGLFKLQLASAFTGVSLLAIGLLAFPSGRFQPRWTAAAAGLVLLWAIFGFFSNDTYRLAIAFGFFGLLVLALGAIWTRYRAYASDPERQQVRWFLLGLAGCAVFTLIQTTLRTVPDSQSELSFLANDFSLFFAFLATASFTAGLIVSLLKYRLYDADAVIERSVTFGVLTVGLLAIFAGSERIIEVLGEEYFGDRLGALAGGLGAAVAAVMISPLHHRITRWAENRFQKNLRRLRLQLPLIVGDLRETAGVERLAQVVLEELASGLRARSSALILGDNVIAARGIDPTAFHEWRRGWIEPARAGLDCQPDDIEFPLRLPLEALGHGRVGWLFLGPRPDGSFYGKDERAALSDIADPIARALDIARERDRERSTARTALLQIDERISEIERRVAEMQIRAS